MPLDAGPEPYTFDPPPDRNAIPLGVASRAGAGACLIIASVETLTVYVIRHIDGAPRSLLYTIGEQFPWWILWIFFMPGILWLAREHRFDDHRWRRSAAIHIACGIAIAMAHGSLFGAFIHFTTDAARALPSVGAQVRVFLLRYLFMDILTYAAAIGGYYSFEYFRRFRRSALAAATADARAARLRLSLSEARIHALRMELNPHFLFNALNAVSGLVRKREHDAAIDMLARLGEILRTTLDRDMPPEVPLAEELELLRQFLAIEQVRFGDRLRVVWDVEPDVRLAAVPPLILQPIVENSLRHGIARRPGPALLRISARRAGTRLELAVRDTGDGITAPGGGSQARPGIGLTNTRERLATLYGGDSTSVELENVAGGGARTTMLLPFRATDALPHVSAGA